MNIVFIRSFIENSEINCHFPRTPLGQSRLKCNEKVSVLTPSSSHISNRLGYIVKTTIRVHIWIFFMSLSDFLFVKIYLLLGALPPSAVVLPNY